MTIKSEVDLKKKKRTKISNEENSMNICQLPLCKYWVCTLKLLYFQSLSLCSILQAWKPLIPALNKRFPLLMYLCLCKQILINGCYSERCTSNWSEFLSLKKKTTTTLFAIHWHLVCLFTGLKQGASCYKTICLF